jgi:hypothetical protein
MLVAVVLVDLVAVVLVVLVVAVLVVATHLADQMALLTEVVVLAVEEETMLQEKNILVELEVLVLLS